MTSSKKLDKHNKIVAYSGFFHDRFETYKAFLLLASIIRVRIHGNKIK